MKKRESIWTLRGLLLGAGGSILGSTIINSIKMLREDSFDLANLLVSEIPFPVWSLLIISAVIGIAYKTIRYREKAIIADTKDGTRQSINNEIEELKFEIRNITNQKKEAEKKYKTITQKINEYQNFEDLIVGILTEKGEFSIEDSVSAIKSIKGFEEKEKEIHEAMANLIKIGAVKRVSSNADRLQLTADHKDQIKSVRQNYETS